MRRATPKDAEALGELWVELVLEEDPKAKPNVNAWVALERKLLELPNYYVFVEEVDGEIIGFASGLFDIDMETGKKYMNGGHLYVYPDHRKSLAGIRLHRKSFNLCKELGAEFLRRRISPNNPRMVERAKKKIGKGYTMKMYIIDEEVK